MDLNVLNIPLSLTLPSPDLLVMGVLLILLSLLLVFLLRRIFVNSLLGILVFLIAKFLGLDLPFLPTLIVSILFGLAGVGAVIVLKVFGLF